MIKKWDEDEDCDKTVITLMHENEAYPINAMKKSELEGNIKSQEITNLAVSRLSYKTDMLRAIFLSNFEVLLRITRIIYCWIPEQCWR